MVPFCAMGEGEGPRERLLLTYFVFSLVKCPAPSTGETAPRRCQSGVRGCMGGWCWLRVVLYLKGTSSMGGSAGWGGSGPGSELENRRKGIAIEGSRSEPLTNCISTGTGVQTRAAARSLGVSYATMPRGRMSYVSTERVQGRERILGAPAKHAWGKIQDSGHKAVHTVCTP